MIHIHPEILCLPFVFKFLIFDLNILFPQKRKWDWTRKSPMYSLSLSLHPPPPPPFDIVILDIYYR